MRYLLILLIFFTLAVADGDKKFENGHFYSKDLTYLKLNSEQKKQIKKILKEYRKDIKKFRSYKDRLTQKKEKLFLNDKFEKQKLKSINIDINSFSSDIEIKLLKKIHKILSKKQRKRFVAYMDEWEIE